MNNNKIKYFYAIIAMLAVGSKVCSMDPSFEELIIIRSLSGKKDTASKANDTKTLVEFAAMGSQKAVEVAQSKLSENPLMGMVVSVAAHREMHKETMRDKYGFSCTGDKHLDAYRNEQRNGGPTYQQREALAKDQAAFSRGYIQEAMRAARELDPSFGSYAPSASGGGSYGASSGGGSSYDGGDLTGRSQGGSGCGLHSITFDGRTYDCRDSGGEMGRGSDGCWGH